MHKYISAYAGRVSLQGSTTDTSHKVSVTQRPLSRHQRMNLEHAVQHSLNISLARPCPKIDLREHTDWPRPGVFRHCPCKYNQNQEPKGHTCGHWKRCHHIYVNSECLCSNTLLQYSNFTFTCMNKLEYINYRVFFPRKKGGAWIIRMVLQCECKCALGYIRILTSRNLNKVVREQSSSPFEHSFIPTICLTLVLIWVG